MSEYLFSNNAISTLASGINNTDVSLFLQTGDGALFPSPGAGQIFTVTLVKSDGTKEICHCTARSTDTLTVVRGQEGTTAVAFLANDVVSLRLTKGALDQYLQLDKVNTFGKTQIWSKGADLTNAEVDVSNILTVGTDGNYFDYSGTDQIDGITTIGIGAVIKIHFDGAVLLTHDAADFILPSGVNYTTTAGDDLEFIEYSTGSFRVILPSLEGRLTARGDMLRRGATGGERFALGADGEAIVSNTTDALWGAVKQIGIAALAVGQAELKSTTGIVSTTNASPTNLTLPGGEYGFYPQVRATATTPQMEAEIAATVISTTYITNIALTASGTFGTPTAYAQQRYVQASPPYNLGDGDIPVFLFAVIDNATRDVISTYIAQDPPWANNGPTNIRPDFKRKGKLYKRMRLIFQEYGTLKAALADGLTRQQIFDRLANDSIVDAEVTQALKQSDMPIVPHPFPDYDIANQTVIILDPVSNFSDRMQMLQDMNDDDFSFGELMHKGYITFGNVDIGAKAPPGVMPVSASWKLI